MASADIAVLKKWQAELRSDLFGRTLPFWLAHSVDDVNGAFFDCLDEDGAVYSTVKHVWLQGREAWMLARVANTFTNEELAAFVAAHPAPSAVVAEPAAVPGLPKPLASPKPLPLTRASLIAAAKAGTDFLLSKAVDPATGHVYFALAADGTPALAQRKPFSATFLIMAAGEVARATGDASYRAAAIKLLDAVIAWDATPGGCGEALGKPGLPGGPPLASALNVPMILLNVISELSEGMPAAEAAAFYASTRASCVSRILKHVNTGRRCVFESVQADGTPDLASPEGRLLNPGHAIEAAWFLLDYAQHAPGGPDLALRNRALEVIDWAFEAGWDGDFNDGTGRVGAPAREAAAQVAAGRGSVGQGAGAGSGGMIYFRDALGLTPTQLEAHMKLWWPQAEAMIAFAKAYEATGDPIHLKRFDTVATWTYEHLVDKVKGEWYGYADRTGTVTHRFKGGPYKGCFHVPRALLYCERAITAALDKAMAAE